MLVRPFCFLCVFCLATMGWAADISGTVTQAGQVEAGVAVNATPLTSRGSISGRVTDRHSGAGIAGALVFWDVAPRVGAASPAIAVTESDGSYILEGLPDGPVDVQVWAVGYGNRFAVNVHAGEQVDFQMDAVQVDDEYFVTIFVAFDNLDFNARHDETWFDRLLYDDTPGAASVRNYFYEISRGRLRIRKGQSAKLTCSEPDLQYPHDNYVRDDLADWALPAADHLINYADPRHDLFDNYDREPGPDGDVDHVLIIPAGLPQSLTGAKSCDMNPVSMYNSVYDLDGVKSGIQNVIPEYAPLGNFVHEIMHAMGEHYVQDLYIGGTCEDERRDDLTTTGKWGLMDVGMYNGLDQLYSDPRGDSCDTYVDPCGDDADCWINRAGAQPAYPMPWTQRERWYRRYYKDLVKTETLRSGDRQTIRLYPYAGSGPETRVISVLDPANSSANWHISLRLPLGSDRGLVQAGGPGSTGVVIDYTDRRLTGSQVLRGPVRVRDARPDSTPPAYHHFSCRFQADDAAFNVGEIDQYREGPLHVQMLHKYEDGSVDVVVSVGATKRAAHGVREVGHIMEAGQDDVDPAHDDDSRLDHNHRHEDLPNLSDDVRFGLPLARYRQEIGKVANATVAANSTVTDALGRYTLDLDKGEWRLRFSKCGFQEQVVDVSLSGPRTLDVALNLSDAPQPIAAISSPKADSYPVGVPLLLETEAVAERYSWFSDRDGLLADVAHASVQLSPGSHVISLTVANGECADTRTVAVTVTDLTAPVIVVDRVPGSGSGPWPVTATVTDAGGPLPQQPLLSYAADGGSFVDLAMTAEGADVNSAEIPALPEGTLVSWHVAATDSAGNHTVTETASFTVSAGIAARLLLLDRDGGDSVNGVGVSDHLHEALSAAGARQLTLSRQGASLGAYNLAEFDGVLICLGGFPSAGRLNSSESDQLRDYLQAGGRVYLEGGDVGYYHRYKSFWSLLGTTYRDDGGTDNDAGATLSGVSGHPISDGLSLTYTSQDYSVESWVDELSAVTAAEAVLTSSARYDATPTRAVSYVGAYGQRCVTSAVSFGGLAAGEKRTRYAESLLAWLLK